MAIKQTDNKCAYLSANLQKWIRGNVQNVTKTQKELTVKLKYIHATIYQINTLETKYCRLSNSYINRLKT